MPRPDVPELSYILAPASTGEKVRALREFLATYQGTGCRFAFDTPPTGELTRTLMLNAYPPDTDERLLAVLTIKLPGGPALN